MELDKITFDGTFAFTNRLLYYLGFRPYTELHPTKWYLVIKEGLPAFVTFQILFWCAFGEIIWLIETEPLTVTMITVQLPCIGFCSIGLCKLFVMETRRNTLSTMVMRLKERWPTTVNSQAQKDMVENYMIFTTGFTTAFGLINVVMVCAFNFLPILEMWYNYFVYGIERRQLPYNIWTPFDSFEGIPYYFVYVYHILAGCVVVIGNMIFDSLYSISIAHLCMHFKLLQDDFREMFDKATENDVGNLKFIANIKLNIRKHKDLISFKLFLEDMFSDILFLNFFGSSIIICLQGFQLTVIKSAYNLVKFFLFFLCFVIELYLICLYGQELLDNSLSIGDAAYESIWYYTHPKCRKLLSFAIHRSQKPLMLTALKFWMVTMQSFSKVLSSAWSYFTILKTVYTELPSASNIKGL